MRKQLGVTLIELMFGLAMIALAALAVSAFMTSLTGQQAAYARAAALEVERAKIEGLLRFVVSQAVDVQFSANNSLNNYVTSGASPSGRIRAFDSDSDPDGGFNATGTMTTLGVFWREGRQSGLSNAVSQFRKTAIYFQKPTATKWGAIYIDLGDGALSPDRSDIILEGLVRLRFLNFQTFDPNQTAIALYDPVTSFDAELTFRRFVASAPGARKSFCPAAEVPVNPACTIDGAWRDDVRTVRLTLRNNVLFRSPTAWQPVPYAPGSVPPGPQPAPRIVPSRLFDLIYFFQPHHKAGLM